MTKEDILQKLKQNKSIFIKYGIKRIAIFGSYARNEATEESDIDLMYEINDETSISYIDFFELEELLCKDFNKKVELVNYKYMNPIIKKTAEKDFIYA
ncbi:MAG: hypothetical protein A2015_02355 [Spirochaetes bacterium GWF1_31_7]|nr:MAG: hypothetical protein A2Y30_06205 [Spirochaetes bacterium GWE1_32_154]OHD50757.1 MAG: hypothetical protein A2015_02355 [Spirochaetes bacterium GWF1_31_7]OHD51964.1 MAG: hypothetical protein A2Y29_07190 [Spirochaetes bacterium GWE2_31_10]OHD74505.1 MAG: hypothetical protein A2355_05955 [Spirochaetes bacterium RIFOXYB1_FULL_32_8]HBD95094.1 nucleotidyltransferase [Spirochaetia bacterium]